MNSKVNLTADEPDVSVIMAAHNGEAYIGSAIRSVINQTHANWELLVVDDGSSDRTGAIVAALSDPRIRYLRQNNKGQAAARNTGISAALGQWIGFLDQDDLWVPDKLQLQLELAKREDVDVIFSDGEIFQDEKTGQSVFGTLCGRFPGAEMFPLLYEVNRIPVLSALVKRRCFAEIALDEDRTAQNCDDYDLWLTLARAGAEFYGMPECLVRYRLHTNQASNNLVQQYLAELRVLEKHGDSPWLPKELRRNVLRVAFSRSIDTLLRSGRYREADLAIKRKGPTFGCQLIAIVQRIVIRFTPSRFSGISRRLYRVKDAAERLWHRSPRLSF